MISRIRYQYICQTQAVPVIASLITAKVALLLTHEISLELQLLLLESQAF